MSRSLRLLPALALLLAAPALRAQSFQGLGFLNPATPASYAADISADGAVIVGYSLATIPNGTTATHAFRWDGAMNRLPYTYPQYPYGNLAHGVSADGTAIVGWGTGAVVGQQRAATRWVGSSPQDVGPPVYSEAYAASADGSVVVGGVSTQTLRWANGSPQVITIGSQSTAADVSADGSIMVGYAIIPGQGGGFRWEDGVAVSLQGLPGDPTDANAAYGISADGTIIVGFARLNGETRMVRWVDGVTEDLGPGVGHSVSADGNVVVGTSVAGSGGAAVIWTPEGGVRDLKAYLEEEHGLNLAGWTLRQANAVSDDGTTIVGDGLNPAGQPEAWRAVLPAAFAVTAPAFNELVRPGEPYTVRFRTTGDVTAVDLYLVERARTEGDGERVLLAEDVPAGPGTYDWDVPEDLLSPSTYLVAVDAADATREAVSARFRVRDPWHLTRVVGTLANPAYEPYVREDHAWSFTQTPDELWPRAYWNVEVNDYDGGRDPFYTPPAGVAAVRYGVPFPEVTGRYRLDSGAFEYRFLHPSWYTFAEAFSPANVYRSLTPVENVPGVLYTNNANRGAFNLWRDRVEEGSFTDAYGTYQGACYGYVISALAAFGDPARFAARFPAVPPGDLGTLPLSTPVRDAIHTAFAYQYGNDDLIERMRGDGYLLGGPPEDVRDFLRDVKVMLQRETREADFVVSFRASDTEHGGALGDHAVLPWRLVRVEEGSSVFRLHVVDPNEGPGTDPYLVLDSLANTWSYPNSGWVVGAGAYVISALETRFLFAPAAPRWALEADGARPAGDALLFADVTAATSSMTDGAGHTAAYDGTALTDTAEDIYPWFEATGQGSEPAAYVAPPDAYALTLGSGDGLATGLRLTYRGRAVGYSREGAPGMADAVAVGSDGHFVATFTGDPASRVAAEASVLTAGDERSFRASGLASGAVGALTLDTVGEEGFVLGGAGAATYTLALTYATDDGVRAFRHAGVALAAGATHTVRPTWADLTSVTVEVDLDGDGTTDETLTLNNTVAAEPGAPGAGAPTAFALGAPRPNPTAGAATLTLDVPTAGAVTVAVYDALGRRVAVLLDGETAAGRRALTLDTAGLPAGVYVVRAVSGAAAAVQRLTVVR